VGLRGKFESYALLMQRQHVFARRLASSTPRQPLLPSSERLFVARCRCDEQFF